MDEQTQQQLVQLVQAAMQGDQQAQQAVQQIMQAAQQGDPQAQQLAQMIQQIAQQLQGQQTQAYRRGGVLDYLKFLRGKCPDGYEMQYFKNGGRAGCKKCQKAQEGEKVSQDPVEEFKCGRKMKKAKCGTKVKKGEKGLNGVNFTRKQVDEYNYTDTKKGQNGGTSQRIVSEDGTLYKGQNGKTGMEGTAVGDSIKGADWLKGEQVREKTQQLRKFQKKANGGSFIPFPNRVLN